MRSSPMTSAQIGRIAAPKKTYANVSRKTFRAVSRSSSEMLRCGRTKLSDQEGDRGQRHRRDEVPHDAVRDDPANDAHLPPRRVERDHPDRPSAQADLEQPDVGEHGADEDPEPVVLDPDAREDVRGDEERHGHAADLRDR